MKHMTSNAMEDAMNEIAKQMRISNSMKLMEELYMRDGIDRAEYVERLKELLKYA